MNFFPIATMSAGEAESLSEIFWYVAIVGGVLLIAGLIGEFPESENWKKKLLYKFAKVAVIIGVGGELIADSAIFKAAEREQQLVNQSIESSLKVQKAMLDQLKPRDITKEQVAKIAALVKERIGTIYLYPLADVEASQYAFAISEVLKAAGADVKLMLPGDPALGFPDKFNASVSITGVTVYGSSTSQRETVELLIRSFQEAGIALIGQFSDKGLPGIVNGKWVADVGVQSPAIFVGLRPLPFSRFPAYATPPELEEFFKSHPPPWEPR